MGVPAGTMERRGTAETTSTRRSASPAVLSALRAHWPLLAVLAAFVGSAFVVPTLAPTGVVEDTIYARSAEILLREGRIEVLPVTAETLVFQASWGALFGLIFGDSLGVLRLATVTLVGLSAIAFYGLCLELGISRGRSALGTALYLFNPLAYALSFSFMSDSYLVALMVIALYFFAKGMRGTVDEYDGRWIVAGSVAASCSFLVRQHGALIPLAVVSFLLVTRRLTRDRNGARLLAQVTAMPIIAFVGYYAWIEFLYSGPPNFIQDTFVKGITDAGAGTILGTAGRLGFVEIMYLGLFFVPLSIAVVPRLWRVARSTPLVGWLAVAATAVVILLGYAFFTRNGVDTPKMPYIPQFLNATGIGPADLRGGRVPLVGARVLLLLTLLTAASALVLALVLFRRLRAPRPDSGTGAGLLVSMLFWQAVAVVPTSLYLRDWWVGLDRYLIPLIPLVIALGLWALRDVSIVVPVAWIGTALVGAFAVAGTHDFLQYQAATWRVASEAHADGIGYPDIDGGSSWGAYRLWEYSYERCPPPCTVEGTELEDLKKAGFTGPILLSAHDVSAWWIGFYAPATNPDSYVVSAEPLVSYTLVRRAEYSSWLNSDPTYIYLLRHRDVEGPP